MIPVSAEMREAIRAGAKQRALLYFVDQGLYFTVNDIVLGSWKYTGSFNPDPELTMGKAISASLDYSLINKDGALNDFTFGEFNAYMGVKVSQFPYMVGTANVVLDFQGNRYAGHSTVPYLTKNGEAYATQPTAPVEALVAIGDTLYCISSNRTVLAIRQTNATKWEDLENVTWLSQEAYTWDSYIGDYSVWTTTVTDDLTWAICKRYIEKHTGASISADNQDALVFENGTAEYYRYTQIGHFYSERPARVRTNVVRVTSYDAMQAKLNELVNGLTTPTTLQGLYNQLVQLTGVTSKATALLNGSMPVPSTDFSDMTYREVLGLIAQASCSYALFDYDGKLDLRWFTQTDISIDEHNYKEFIPCEYRVETIDKFQARSNDSDVGIIVGSGTNAYVLQNHPFFIFDSDAAGRPYCQNIYDRLYSLGEYTPGDVKWFTDFTIQPGDIISVGYDGDAYRFPIFSSEYTWTGISTGTLGCTGSEVRGVLNTVARRTWREQTAQGRKYTELTVALEGIVVKTGIDNLSTGESLYSKITTMADSVALTFRKIGASGYTATGITTISENGIRVTHSDMSNCYTEMSASGFMIKDSSNRVIGGLMSLNGKVVTAMSTLYNPSYPSFGLEVSRFNNPVTAGTTLIDGLQMMYNNAPRLSFGLEYDSVTYQVRGETVVSVDDFSVIADGKTISLNVGSYYLDISESEGISLRSTDLPGVYVTSTDVIFRFYRNGVIQTVKASDYFY